MNFDEIVVKESPGLCRCCLSEGCYKDLGTEYTWMNDPEIYADMLLDCFDIGISQHNDGPNGPKRLICEVCITRLRDACNFKKQVLDSEKRFINMLGRGEFRPKMLIYQPQNKELKSEAVETEEPTEYGDLTEVEFLEDMDEEEVIKTEDISVATTSEDTDGPKPKRGRPRKEEEKPPKPGKKAKVTKGFDDMFDRISTLQRKDDMVRLFTTIIENSTVIPFRWHCNKYMCFFCGCPFSDSVSLKTHHQEEHSDTKIRSAFRTLLRNSKVKFEVSEIKCKLCSEVFPKIDGLLEHFKGKHDLKMNLELRSELYAFKLSDEKISCDECGEEFQFFGTLLKHFHAFHNKNEPYLCEICGMGFIAKSNVSAHVKNVHNRESPCNCLPDSETCVHSKKKQSVKLLCPKCPVVLTSHYLKKRHLAKVHDVKECQFVCDMCPQVFPIRYRLLIHKQRVHLKQRSFTCAVCGYRAFNKDYLARHMVSHDDSRPFECEICKKAFQRKKTLEFHRRIHTNDRRYVCNECGKAFVQTTSLKLHYRVHHPKEGAREGGDWS